MSLPGRVLHLGSELAADGILLAACVAAGRAPRGDSYPADFPAAVGRGLAESSAAKIIERRNENRLGNTIERFVQDCELARDEVTALAAAGVFAEFDMARSAALWRAEASPFKPMLDSEDEAFEWRSENRLETIRKDFRAFGTSLGEHPVAKGPPEGAEV